jgi:hypothetical protein
MNGAMNDLAVAQQEAIALPALVERAAKALASAKTSAKVLEARDMANVAYGAAKVAARFAKAKKAHDDLLSAVYRAQADALVIEAQAKRRLADEYDAAQERGEAPRRGSANRHVKKEERVHVHDLGFTHDDLHDIRTTRDAELAEPGIVRRTVDEAVANREEPTKAKVRKAVKRVAKRGKAAKRNPKRKDAAQPTAQPAEQSAIQQAGAFHHELMDWTNEFCARIEAWRAEHPDLDADSRFCFVQALEMASMRLQQLAQALDGR